MVRHHGYEDITLGADDCTAHGRATVARTEAMLLILCGISGGRVLAQDGVGLAHLPDQGAYLGSDGGSTGPTLPALPCPIASET